MESDKVQPYVNCDICDKKIQKNFYLKHTKNHFKEKLQCSVCETTFMQGGSLKRHEVQIHGIINGELGKYDKKYKYKEEILIPCDICGKFFKGKYVLRYHMRTHTQEKPHKCDICQKSFIQENILSRHRQYVHRKDELEEFKCDICGQNYLGKQSLLAHKRYAHRDGKNKNTADEICSVCKAKLKTKILKEAHMRFFHQGKDICGLCNEKIRSKLHLKDHMEQKHSEAAYGCYICEKKFKQKRILTQHITSVHGDKNLPCKMCKKLFSSKVILRIHEKRHAVKESFNCEICNKFYLDKCSLKKHVKSHNENTSESRVKDQKCTICGKEFFTSGELRQHRTIHTTRVRDKKCNICGKEFFTNSTLKSHADVHTTLMHFKCHYCARGFKQGGTHQRHEKVCIERKISEASSEEAVKLREKLKHERSLNDLADELLKTVGDLWHCIKCDLKNIKISSKSRYQMKQHVKTHLEDP